jgi:hypothetical protein
MDEFDTCASADRQLTNATRRAGGWTREEEAAVPSRAYWYGSGESQSSGDPTATRTPHHSLNAGKPHESTQL